MISEKKKGMYKASPGSDFVTNGDYEHDVAPAGLRDGAVVQDAVFGELDGKGPNYRAVSLLLFAGTLLTFRSANGALSFS